VDQAMSDTEVPHSGPGGWSVWRQDDNGNQYEVSRHGTQEEAVSVATAMEARGHKQTYWVTASAS
jgi:hypothetical protein